MVLLLLWMWWNQVPYLHHTTPSIPSPAGRTYNRSVVWHTSTVALLHHSLLLLGRRSLLLHVWRWWWLGPFDHVAATGVLLLLWWGWGQLFIPHGWHRASPTTPTSTAAIHSNHGSHHHARHVWSSIVRHRPTAPPTTDVVAIRVVVLAMMLQLLLLRRRWRWLLRRRWWLWMRLAHVHVWSTRHHTIPTSVPTVLWWWTGIDIGTVAAVPHHGLLRAYVVVGRLHMMLGRWN